MADKELPIELRLALVSKLRPPAQNLLEQIVYYGKIPEAETPATRTLHTYGLVQRQNGAFSSTELGRAYLNSRRGRLGAMSEAGFGYATLMPIPVAEVPAMIRRKLVRDGHAVVEPRSLADGGDVLALTELGENRLNYIKCAGYNV